MKYKLEYKQKKLLATYNRLTRRSKGRLSSSRYPDSESCRLANCYWCHVEPARAKCVKLTVPVHWTESGATNNNCHLLLRGVCEPNKAHKHLYKLKVERQKCLETVSITPDTCCKMQVIFLCIWIMGVLITLFHKISNPIWMTHDLRESYTNLSHNCSRNYKPMWYQKRKYINIYESKRTWNIRNVKCVKCFTLSSYQQNWVPTT